MNPKRDRLLFWFGAIAAVAAALAIFDFFSDRIADPVRARPTYGRATCPRLQPEQVDRLLDLVEGGHATPEEAESLSRTIACSMAAMHTGLPDTMASIDITRDNQVAYAAPDVELSLSILFGSDHSTVRRGAADALRAGFSRSSIRHLQELVAEVGSDREQEAAKLLAKHEQDIRRWAERGSAILP